MNSISVYETITRFEQKTIWQLGLNNNENNKIRNNIISHIFKPVAKSLKITSENSNNKKIIYINCPYINNDDEYKEAVNFLELKSIEAISNTIPEYKNLKDSQSILEYGDEDYSYTNNEKASKDKTLTQYRKDSHIFRKNVLDIWGSKCAICNIDFPDIIEAAHILDWSKAKWRHEQIDRHNGIALCRNHHRLFDTYAFVFDEEWKLIMSKKIKESKKDYKSIDLLLNENIRINYKKLNGYNQLERYMNLRRKDFIESEKK